MKALIKGVALLLFLLSPLKAAEPLTAVPYRVDYNGWLTVSVMVNDQGPYDFIIDTGATQTLVFQRLADELTFPPTGGAWQNVIGITEQKKFPPHFIGNIKVGNAALGDLTTVILPDWNIAERPVGLLGLDFLSNYICIFDAKTGLLELYEHSAPPSRSDISRWRMAPLAATDFGIENNILYTTIGKINSRPVTFMLDLGASGTMINRSAAGKVAKANTFTIRVRPSGSDARERITDALQKSEGATSLVAQRFQVGSKYWYQRTFSVYNAPVFDELGVQNQPFGLLGADLIRDRSFLLDFKNEEIRFGKRAKRR